MIFFFFSEWTRKTMTKHFGDPRYKVICDLHLLNNIRLNFRVLGSFIFYSMVPKCFVIVSFVCAEKNLPKMRCHIVSSQHIFIHFFEVPINILWSLPSYLAIEVIPILDDRLTGKFLKPWKSVLCIHFLVCLCVCPRATEHIFWPRNLIFGLSDPWDMRKKRIFLFLEIIMFTLFMGIQQKK